MTSSVVESIRELEAQVHELRNKLAKLRAEAPRTLLSKEYHFKTVGRKTEKLSDLFGRHSELFVIHSLGESCPYCTLWADGFNGLLGHLETRCSVVIVSDDPPEVQQDFLRSRGWKFKMVSSEGSLFSEDFGFRDGQTRAPGGSTFFKDENGHVFHCNDAMFSPGDSFCSMWYVLDMLPEGENNWRPKIVY